MNKELFVEELLNQLDVPIVSSTNKNVVGAIVDGYRKHGWNAQSFSNFTKKYFPDKKPNTKIFTYLMNLLELSLCTKCNEIKDKECFSKNKSRDSGLHTYCKECMSTYQKEYYPDYYRENKHKYIEAKIRYYSKLKFAIPPWADLEKIKQIYLNCPKGYHVDHYYPLQGENTCGLHVENNLQYLKAFDNLSKSNKLPNQPYINPLDP